MLASADEVREGGEGMINICLCLPFAVAKNSALCVVSTHSAMMPLFVCPGL